MTKEKYLIDPNQESTKEQNENKIAETLEEEGVETAHNKTLTEEQINSMGELL